MAYRRPLSGCIALHFLVAFAARRGGIRFWRAFVRCVVSSRAAFEFSNGRPFDHLWRRHTGRTCQHAGPDGRHRSNVGAAASIEGRIGRTGHSFGKREAFPINRTCASVTAQRLQRLQGTANRTRIAIRSSSTMKTHSPRTHQRIKIPIRSFIVQSSIITVVKDAYTMSVVQAKLKYI